MKVIDNFHKVVSANLMKPELELRSFAASQSFRLWGEPSHFAV